MWNPQKISSAISWILNLNLIALKRKILTTLVSFLQIFVVAILSTLIVRKSYIFKQKKIIFVIKWLIRARFYLGCSTRRWYVFWIEIFWFAWLVTWLATCKLEDDLWFDLIYLWMTWLVIWKIVICLTCDLNCDLFYSQWLDLWFGLLWFVPISDTAIFSNLESGRCLL